MNADSSVAALIARLRPLPAAEREAELARACAADPGLAPQRRAIRAELENTPVEPASSPPPVPAALDVAMHVLESALELSAPATAGTLLGPYQLVEKIGEGGFGTVWKAEQQAPIQRSVALKIIKVGMDTEEVIARFEAERQALALMDHPNIARVFDAGATSSGRPYFVMELVRGLPITRFCNEHQLSPEARLRLFVSVCQAVHHAHQKGVIHRDLKPSNVLVTLHDGAPVPKVIDFGIAKATQGRLTDRTLFTKFHAFMGTPAYTSPEQMEMCGLDVDTRADIYSLGVLLYELLAGEPPFDPTTLLHSGLEAMRRTVLEVDPPRPSHRLGTLSAERQSTIARQRGTNAASLSLLLRGDLDWIVMRCLEKDRTRRYESASALAREIQRHLAHEPVTARPQSALYRARKFTRRHKVGVTAAAAISLSLVGGLIASYVMFTRERDAHGRALAAERQQNELRRDAEAARVAEVRRAARTALDLANRNLADGRVADALAYLVYAARKDPNNHTLAPRLASVLTSHNFMLPQAAPVDCGSRVLAVRFSRDGRSFFAGTEDGTLRVFDAQSGVVLRQFKLGREVVPRGWDFPPGNDAVVGTRSPDNLFSVHDVSTGLARIQPLKLDPGVGLPEGLRAAGLSPTGRWIYANAPHRFWLWSATTGALHLHHEFPSEAVIGGADFSPADDVLAVSVGDDVLRWSLPTGAPLGPRIRIREGDGPVRVSGSEVRFSPDGSRLAVVDPFAAQLFDAATGKLIRALPPIAGGHNVSFTAFAGNDRLLGRTTTLSGWWDLADGRFIPLPVPHVSEVALDAASRRAVAFTRDGWLRVFEIGGGSLAEAAWPQNAAYSIAISPDGTQVLMGTSDGMLLRFAFGRGAARPLVVPRPRHPSTAGYFLPGFPARLLALAPDHAKVIDVASGREVAGGFVFPERVRYSLPTDDFNFLVAGTDLHGWQSWELGAGTVKRRVSLDGAGRVAPGRNVTTSRAQNRVAMNTPSTAQVWDLRTGSRVGPAISHPGEIVNFSANFSPDGNRLALSTADGAALVFDVATGRTLLSLGTRRQVRTFSALFSPDGQRLLTTNYDGEFQLWDAASGHRVGPGGRMTASVAHPIFSPDGRWAAIRNTTFAALLDARTGAVVGQTLPAGSIQVRFSPDGTRLATTGHTRFTQVWDVPGGEPVTEPLPNPPDAMGLQFSPDGRYMKTENQVFRFWSVPPALPDGSPPPDWLLELATLCASRRVNDDGQLVPALETARNIERIRNQVATLPAETPLAEWGRWVLDPRADRPIAPGFSVTPAQAGEFERLAGAK